jgi:cellulose synthase (UDP-forming)
VWVDTLSTWELAAPTLFVIASIYLIGPMLPLTRSWARLLIFSIVGIVLVRYMSWRLFDTVLPARGTWYEVGWVWFCLTIEWLSLLDISILYLTFLRATDHSSEADRHEARLRARAPQRLPWVDVYIPTYNEPFAVLEKTLTGALSIEYPNFRLWVLDDGRRSWLKDFCEAKGIGYLTRPNNAHAKAGNINHALTKTDAEYVAVFDADFIPQRNFLLRTLGFFSDPRVGIVQTPHAFYNHDPMQANLALRRALPNDQSFFFESIMPSRDGWNAAFCCGSNSVVRRSALRRIGDALPTESLTEDILLTLALLQRGFVTRYLCERLAYGLAPESLDAFFVQRQRWARGGIQTLFLASGPFGRGISFVQRLMFLPTHWLSQSPVLMLALIAPLVFLWTGILPFVDVTTEAEVYYFVPTILALMGGVWVYAPKHFSPLAAYVLGTFQSFRLLPHVVQTIVRPFGHIFKVTPKGHDSGPRRYEYGIFWSAAILIALTVTGLLINTIPEYQIVPMTAFMPIAAFLAALNIVVLFFVCMLSLQAPIRRAEERFQIDEPIWLFNAAGALTTGRTKNLSLSGIGIAVDGNRPPPAIGESIRLYVTEVGFVTGNVARRGDGFVGVQFDLPPSVERDLLIRKLFTAGLDAVAVSSSAWSAAGAMLRTIWSHRTAVVAPTVASESAHAPESLVKLPAESLVIAPRAEKARLAEIGAQRRQLAA